MHFVVGNCSGQRAAGIARRRCGSVVACFSGSVLPRTDWRFSCRRTMRPRTPRGPRAAPPPTCQPASPRARQPPPPAAKSKQAPSSKCQQVSTSAAPNPWLRRPPAPGRIDSRRASLGPCASSGNGDLSLRTACVRSAGGHRSGSWDRNLPEPDACSPSFPGCSTLELLHDLPKQVAASSVCTYILHHFLFSGLACCYLHLCSCGCYARRSSTTRRYAAMHPFLF